MLSIQDRTGNLFLYRRPSLIDFILVIPQALA